MGRARVMALLSLLVASPACDSSRKDPTRTAVILVDVLGLSADDPYGTPVKILPRVRPNGDLVRGSRVVEESKFLGDYGWGDGFGRNVTLSLRPNHAFQAKVSGCGGLCGVSSGVWVVDDGGLVLTTLSDDAEYGPVGLPGRLSIVDTPGVMYGLLDEGNETALQEFLRVGLESSCAFNPTATWPRDGS